MVDFLSCACLGKMKKNNSSVDAGKFFLRKGRIRNPQCSLYFDVCVVCVRA